MGVSPAALGGAVGRVQRQRILNVRHVLLVEGQLAALRFVADQNGGAVGGLHAQQIVQVGFVGREDDVELGIFEVQPGKVALVIVVGEERGGAHPQEPGESGVAAEGGGIAQRLGHRLEELLVLHVIRHGDEPVALPFDHRVWVVDGGPVLGMLLEVLLEAGAREVVGIQLVPRQHRLSPMNGRF